MSYIGLGYRGTPSPDDTEAIQHLDAWSAQKGESHDASAGGTPIMHGHRRRPIKLRIPAMLGRRGGCTHVMHGRSDHRP